jgi:hypothetical protein
MAPGALIVAFLSFWSIMVVGVYLTVTALGNLRDHRIASHPLGARGPLFQIRYRLLQSRDVCLLFLGILLAGSGIVFLYLVAYG